MDYPRYFIVHLYASQIRWICSKSHGTFAEKHLCGARAAPRDTPQGVATPGSSGQGKG
jgi:hypothetical protein